MGHELDKSTVIDSCDFLELLDAFRALAMVGELAKGRDADDDGLGDGVGAQAAGAATDHS